jgi:hypothetical protein
LAGHNLIDDDNDAEDEVEIVDQPAPMPSLLKSQKKTMKGGKKWVRKNIAQTSNTDGDILDLDQMALDDGEEEESELRGKHR